MTEKNSNDRIVSVYKVQDELTGNMLKALLEKENIPAIVRSFQIPSYDSAMTVACSAWGDIQVKEEDAGKALEIIKEYLKSWNGGER